ncbi:hypothetical protein NADE_004401 [Nannochloris sp. 'desiccata']|nr:hypothetical protein NADE_004401 [Chlorella desiccata (nom. nud.)]
MGIDIPVKSVLAIIGLVILQANLKIDIAGAYLSLSLAILLENGRLYLGRRDLQWKDCIDCFARFFSLLLNKLLVLLYSTANTCIELTAIFMRQVGQTGSINIKKTSKFVAALLEGLQERWQRWPRNLSHRHQEQDAASELKKWDEQAKYWEERRITRARERDEKAKKRWEMRLAAKAREKEAAAQEQEKLAKAAQEKEEKKNKEDKEKEEAKEAREREREEAIREQLQKYFQTHVYSTPFKIKGFTIYDRTVKNVSPAFLRETESESTVCNQYGWN